jgi:hypothetical protein
VSHFSSVKITFLDLRHANLPRITVKTLSQKMAETPALAKIDAAKCGVNKHRTVYFGCETTLSQLQAVLSHSLTMDDSQV